jgi:hypothetical protein
MDERGLFYDEKLSMNFHKKIMVLVKNIILKFHDFNEILFLQEVILQKLPLVIKKYWFHILLSEILLSKQLERIL